MLSVVVSDLHKTLELSNGPWSSVGCLLRYFFVVSFLFSLITGVVLGLFWVFFLKQTPGPECVPFTNAIYLLIYFGIQK